MVVHTKSRSWRFRRFTQQLTQQMQVVENEVQQALVVLDAETGNMFNYRQLMRHPTYKKSWQLSSANEFGRLANGVGGRIKGINTIKFIRMRYVKKD
jgi:hypothetical protein